MILNNEQINYIINHAKKEYPKEVCGIIAGIVDNVKKIYRMKNVSEKPEICYFMDAKEQFKIFKKIRKQSFELLGIYHSHTNSKAYPSLRDVEMAYYDNVVYLIVSLENFNNPKIKAYKILNKKIKEQNIEKG
ncbi:MAG: hypothetical protein A2539_10675 [Elusimicrobia bacterium RIFOXYD2_FULL_34_15]|nr:MAG: hypothetical protein A2539_10675 [Elusimicrobia bacterium RIFOXYD2_FULL_34_15]